MSKLGRHHIPMLHTKFQGHRPSGYGDFKGFLPYFGSGGHLGHVHVYQDLLNKFSFPHHEETI